MQNPLILSVASIERSTYDLQARIYWTWNDCSISLAPAKITAGTPRLVACWRPAVIITLPLIPVYYKIGSWRWNTNITLTYFYLAIKLLSDNLCGLHNTWRQVDLSLKLYNLLHLYTNETPILFLKLSWPKDHTADVIFSPLKGIESTQVNVVENTDSGPKRPTVSTM